MRLIEAKRKGTFGEGDMRHDEDDDDDGDGDGDVKEHVSFTASQMEDQEDQQSISAPDSLVIKSVLYRASR